MQYWMSVIALSLSVIVSSDLMLALDFFLWKKAKSKSWAKPETPNLFTLITDPCFFYLYKGQFSCGNKHCDGEEGLKSWEVNFGYVEHGEKRNALVKLSKSDKMYISLKEDKYHTLEKLWS